MFPVSSRLLDSQFETAFNISFLGQDFMDGCPCSALSRGGQRGRGDYRRQGLHIYKGRGKQEGFHHMQERTGIRQHWLTLNFYYKRQLLNIIYKFTLYIFVFFFLLRDDADTQLSNMMILINAGLFGDAQ
jgi:hypothetical protein